jgi:hypothetical protein
MAALTGTNLVSQKWKEGDVQVFKGKHTIATTLASADTITWTNALPNMGGVTVLDVLVDGVPMDKHGSPTGTFILGTTTDTNGLIIAGAASLAVPQTGAGAQIGAVVTDTDIILTLGGTVATGGADGDGDVYVTVVYGCGDLT